MRIKALSVGLAAVLAVGCTDQATSPTALNDAAVTPTFSFTNNPDNGNPRIVRFGSLLTFLIIDDDANLFSLQSGRDYLLGCRDVTALSFEDVQRILHDPDDPDSDKIKETRLGRDAFISVFQGPWNTVVDCEDLLSRLLAEGIGNFTNTDNDLNVFLRENTNANAFGLTGQGKLELLTGGPAHYNAVSKCVWDGTDFSTLKCVDKINFKPIGK